MFTDKLTLAIAEAAKKCMDEELKGNQHKIDANKNGKVDAQDFKLLRKQKGVSEELKGNQHKIDANKNGKIDAQDFKLLRKEETVNEEEGKNGYVAFSHDGRKADIFANSSYEAHRKAIKHFDAPKAKHHMVHVHLAKKDGKDYVHTATESVQEAAIDDLRDRQAAKREANPYGTSAKKEDPTKRTVQGHQYGGTKQKDEKEVEESVQIDELSKGTLANYVNKSVEDRVQRIVMSKPKTGKEAVSNMNKNIKRAEGQKLAISKLAKEETMSDEDMAQREKIVKSMKKNLKGFKARYGDDAEKVMYATATKQAMKEEEQLDEISKATLGSYVKKASKDVHFNTREGELNNMAAYKSTSYQKQSDYAGKSLKQKETTKKRLAGISKAVDKLTKEEVTNDGFKAELEDNKAKAAGTKKQPDVHKAAVQSVKQESFSEKLSVLKEGVRSFLKGKNNG